MQCEGQVDDFERATVRSKVDREILLKWVDVRGGQKSSVLKCCRISIV